MIRVGQTMTRINLTEVEFKSLCRPDNLSQVGSDLSRTSGSVQHLVFQPLKAFESDDPSQGCFD